MVGAVTTDTKIKLIEIALTIVDFSTHAFIRGLLFDLLNRQYDDRGEQDRWSTATIVDPSRWDTF